MGMCRFTGVKDVEYRKVAAALCRMTNAIFREPGRREFPSIDEEQRRVLVESLRFYQIDARQMIIKNGHAKTYICLGLYITDAHSHPDCYAAQSQVRRLYGRMACCSTD
jgi:hypothetical protein